MHLVDFSSPAGWEQEKTAYYLSDSARGEVFKEQGRKVVYRVDGGPYGGPVVVKKWFERGKVRRVKNWLRGGSRGVREAERMLWLAAAGVGTPRLIAWGTALLGEGPDLVSFNICEYMPGLRRFREFLAERRAGLVNDTTMAQVRLRVVEQLERLHRAGLAHHDLHGENIVLRWKEGGEVEVLLVDTLAVTRGRGALIRRVCDLGKFLYWMDTAPVERRWSESERWEFLEAYYAATRELWPVGQPLFLRIVEGAKAVIGGTYVAVRTLRSIE